MNTTKPGYKLAFNIAFLLFFVSLAALHTLKIIELDSITISLLVLGMMPLLLPYINRNFRAIEIFGIKAELMAKIEKQDEKLERQEVKLEEQQKLINELATYSMSESIFHHLCGITLLKRYIYRDTEFF
jgi:hypothetical protein